VQKAVLRLWVFGVVTPGTVEVVPVVAPWQEGTIAGDTSPILGTPVASFPVASGDTLHFVDVDVTGLVSDWARGLQDNHGLALRAASASVNVVFDTKESIVTSHAPELEVVLASAGPQAPRTARTATSRWLTVSTPPAPVRTSAGSIPPATWD
jgi:hypothetical protein